MLETLVYLAVGLITLGIPAIYFARYRRASRQSASTLQKAVESGLDEPASIHPFINPDICIGSAACVAACPEQNVLGLIDNRGKLVNPSHCIGHGACQAACPVDAITLVFGTQKRGVDIPHITSTFESNVKGIFIAGELGGMGLIRNAVKQGWEAVQYISRSLKDEPRRGDDIHDLAIIGAGPAGIAASLQAINEGLDFVTYDQDDLGGTILTYPRRKLVMTQPMDLPLYGKITAREIEKERLLDIFGEVCNRTGLKIQAGDKVNDIRKVDGYFEVASSQGSCRARRLLLAIGRRGSPRKLGVPGEKSGKVAYRLLDPERFAGLNLLVVGGGDSAVEAALALARQPGSKVHLSYRGEKIFRIKEGNLKKLEKAAASGALETLYESNVTAIESGSVTLEQKGSTKSLPNDHVFIFAGGELPTDFLKRAGVEFTRKFGDA